MFLSKLLKEKEKGRVSGQSMYEKTVSRPILFNTRYGGVRPLEYVTETPEYQMAMEEPMRILQKLIDDGMIDEYSDPANLFDLVDLYIEKSKNSVERQSQTYVQVIESIQALARCGRKENQREMEQLENERENLLGVDYVKDEKGIGERL